MTEIKKIDAKGLSCPQPVILAGKAIKAGELPFEIEVDTVTARENVTRIAKKQGCTVRMAEQTDKTEQPGTAGSSSEGTFTLVIEKA